MGQVCSSQPDDQQNIEEKNLNDRVGKELEESRAAAKKTHKLLLLGTGNSGKSTFFKQLLRIHNKDMSKDKQTSRRYIHDSIIHQMQNIIRSCTEEHNFEISDDIKESVNVVSNLSRDTTITPEIAKDIAVIWNDNNIKKTYQERRTLQIVDSCPYFFNSILRIGKKDYIPTEEDILQARIPTSGILESTFEIKNNSFEIYDVGGQRSERSKWINCFDIVDAILFVASLSCYDQNLYEDEYVNAMVESLELFGEIINSRYFKRTSMILFLNKRDLFEEKIKNKSLKICFKDYNLKDFDYSDGITFLKNKFKSMSDYDETNKQIYTHVTCAIDQDNVDKIFDDVQNHVVIESLKRNGLM